MILLQVESISYSISDKQILDDISFSVAQGQFIGVIGPNGSGKSTMLKIIYRHLKQTSGLVTLFEKDLLQFPQKNWLKILQSSVKSPVLLILP